MKKNSIIKAITIIFLVYAVLSWIIPGGTFSGGTFSDAGTTPVGIGDFFIYGISTAITSIFVLIAVVLLLIGGLYGVMNKTGVYQKVVEGAVKKFSGKEKVFLVISILVFAVLASLTTLTLPLFVMVPFFVAVILLLGYDKMTAMLSTVGAILVGNMGAIFGYNTGGYNYVNYFFGLKTTENIAFKIILFVLLTAVLIFFTLRTSKLEKKDTKKTKKTSKKKEEKVEEKEEAIIPLYKKVDESKKSAMPLVIVMILSVVISLVAMFNWTGALNVEKTIFTTWHENITNVKLNGYPLFANLIGSVNPFGSWSNYEFAMLLVITILVIGFVYNLKVKETYEAAVEGMKEMLPVAVVAALANVLLLVVNSAGSTYIATIYNFFFKLNKGFNFIIMSVASFIGSIGYSDFPYLLNSIYDPVNAKYAKHIKEVAFIVQAMYGYAMLLVPTSVGLVAGLQYLNISFKEWFKENWRLLVSLLLVALIMIIILVLV